MTRALSALLLVAALGVLALTSCDLSEISATIVVAQVGKTMDPESNTTTILIGNTTIANLLHPDWMRTPAPGDTGFVGSYAFPVQISPIAGATCVVNTDTVTERNPGIYFKAGTGLQYLHRYDLAIWMPDGNTVTASAFLPDSFSITAPVAGDSVLTGSTLAVNWSRSDSAQSYLIGIHPTDTLSQARGWSDSRADTTCVIPATAFQDSLGNYVPGEYLLGITAVNGGWNGSGLDLYLNGGNLNGAKGVYGCAVYARPVLVNAR